jgi:hypothetical protein
VANDVGPTEMAKVNVSDAIGMRVDHSGRVHGISLRGTV